MKRSGPLKRTTPLKSTSGLRRTSALQRQAGRESLSARATPVRRSAIARTTPMKAAKPAPAVPTKQRDRLRVRADSWCEIRQAGCLGYGTDPSHRVSRGMGGRHGAAAVEAAQLSNVVWACRACHDLCHDRPRFAERMGWFVREGIDPRTVPVLIGGQMVLLLDDGGVLGAAA